MDKEKRQSLRTQIVWAAAIIAFLVGVGLAIAGFCVPPEGQIHGSVLTFVGEVFTFFSAIMGIGEYTRVQIAKLRRIGDGEEVE